MRVRSGVRGALGVWARGARGRWEGRGEAETRGEAMEGMRSSGCVGREVVTEVDAGHGGAGRAFLVGPGVVGVRARCARAVMKLGPRRRGRRGGEWVGGRWLVGGRPPVPLVLVP